VGPSTTSSIGAEEQTTDEPQDAGAPALAPRRWSLRELFRRGVPDDFIAFVAAEKDTLRTQCDAVTGHEELAEVMRREVLASVALRWRWWQLRQAPARARAAAGLLQRGMRREERAWPKERDRTDGAEARRSPRSGTAGVESGRMRVVPAELVAARPDRSAADLAGIVWYQAGRIRRARRAAATVAVVTVAILALISPRLVRSLPPPNVGPTAVPAGVLLLPAYDKLAGLPSRSITLLPASLDIGSDSVALAPTPLREKPAPKVLALLRHGDGAFYAFVPDGTVRTIDNPEVTGSGARLYSTALSPDGLRAVFPSPNGIYVLDVTTGAIHEVPTGGPPSDPVWRSNRVLVVPNFQTSLQVNVDTGVFGALATTTGMDIVDQQGSKPIASMLELLPANASPRLRLWHAEPIVTDDPVKASPPITDVEDRPIFGPPWIGHWSGPGYGNGDLLVRACGADTITLPTKDGVARSAIGALASNGLYIATLVGSDQTALEVLGMIDPETVLINAVGTDTSTLLAWTPRQALLQRATTVSRTVVVSLADPSTAAS
jgi:hypothetical protein